MNTRPTDTNDPLPDVIDERILGTLYDGHYEMVLRYCHRRLYVHAAAEDVTSNVFLRVAEHIRSFTGRSVGEFRSWLYGIASHEIAAYLRKHRRRQRLFETALQTGEFIRQDNDRDGNAKHTPNVLTAMLQLHPTDQALLSLRYWENLRHEDIAKILGLRNGAVRTRLNRALQRLRKLLPDNRGE
jgi:RNA polymerase sigma-70 factor (ECF subfamily)